MKYVLVIITLIALFLTTTYDNEVSQENTITHKNSNTERKIKRSKCRVNYYANCVATFNLILCGDIELNPGPGLRSRNNTPKCSVCNKGVGTNRKRLQCSQCHNLTHVTCLNISKFEQKHYTAKSVNYWTCNDCTLSILPFYNTRDLNESFTNEIDFIPPTENTHLKKLQENPNYTSIAHLNVQAIMSTFNEFSVMLNEYKFDVIALTETWLQDNSHQQNYVQINGYNTVFKNRTSKKGGGVGFYIKETLNFKVRYDLSRDHNSLEVLFIEIRGRNKNTPTLICVAYQPSSNETDKLDWLEKFEHLLADVYSKWEGVMIITGDLNIDLLGNQKESIKRYKDMLHTFSLYQHVTKATRKNKTLIDHICSNIHTKVIHCDVINTDEISDHDTPYTIFNMKKERFERRYKYVRNEKNLDLNKFVDDFNQLPTSLVYSFDDPDDQISTLNKLITDCITEHAPTKRVKFTRPPAPWMNDPEIISAKNTLEHLRTTSRDANHTDSNIRETYREARNTYKKSITSKKSAFIKKTLSSKNSKEVWETVHRIINPPKKRIKLNPNDLNRYFTTLASKLCEKDNKAFDQQKFLNSLPKERSNNAFVIKHTNYAQVRKFILSLRNDCSSGYDQIPVKFLKPVVDKITSPIVHIINNSIDKQIFADNWKIARACPIPRVDNPLNVENFRPISVLPVLSKIYEKVILHQLSGFIEKSSIYNASQSGFRKGHSTTTMLLKFRDDIQKALNRNEVTTSILIDYSKAFDTIDHETLLKKLVNLNFDNSSIKIIKCYLTNRQQYVQIDDQFSPLLPIYFGVPQGSILGPVLFNIYVSELPTCIQSQSIQYADDTTVYKSSKINNILPSIQTLESDILSLSKWSSENGLIFNNDKLKSIVFSSIRQKITKDKSYLIRSGGKSIQQEPTVKLLGIIFNQHLLWTDQINAVVKSTYGVLRILKTFKRFTPFKVRKSLAEALILSRLNYCNVVYGQLPVYLQNRLQRVQNCAAGYVLGRYARLIDSLSLNWLPVVENIDFNIVKYAYQALNDKLWPTCLHTETVKHNRSLRSQNSGPKIDYAEKHTFQDQSAIFNDLPLNIRQSIDKNVFSREARGYYKDKALARALSL